MFPYLLCTKSGVTREGHRTYFGGRAQDCWSHGAQVSRSQYYEAAYGIKSPVGISVFPTGLKNNPDINRFYILSTISILTLLKHIFFERLYGGAVLKESL